MQDNHGGFSLGSTIQAETKGIWMWIGDFFNDPSRALVLLDTEGLNDAEKGDASHDMNLFILSVLLGSVFIYNTLSVIDASALNGLHYATEISRIIAADSKNETLTLAQHFPHFIWIIRDHFLKLEIDGRSVEPKDYLEHCLKPKKGHSDNITKFNAMREALRRFFPERDCFVFPRPVPDNNALQRLDTVSDDQLTHEFKAAGEKFVRFIEDNGRNKMIKGTVLTGSSFAGLAQGYVRAVMSRNINIESTFKVVTEMENRKAVDRATSKIKDFLCNLEENFPLDEDAFSPMILDHLNEIKSELIASCMSIETSQDILDEFEEKMTDLCLKYKHANAEAAKQKCEEVLQRVFATILDNHSTGDYMRPGGHGRLKSDIEEATENYLLEHEVQELGYIAETSQNEFQEETLDPILESVLAADMRLTEAQKEIERSQMEAKTQEALARIREDDYRQLERQMSEMEIKNEEILQQIEQKLAQVHKQQMEDIQRQLNNDFDEHRRLYEQGQREAAKSYEQQISALQSSITALQNRKVVIERQSGCRIL